MDFSYHTTNWQTDAESLRQIREQVFLIEQQVPVADEWDNKDSTAIHFLVRAQDQTAVGCARLIIEQNQTLFHIGRVAVLKSFRNHGIGRHLMNHVIAFCRSQNADAKIYLHAQTSRQVFYEHLHFIAQGPIFMDANIPHIEMWYTR